MATELKLPELGEGIDSGDVLEILVSVGDTIDRDQGIVELETEKATVSVPASQAGKVAKILVKVGDTVKVGQALIEIESVSAPTNAANAGEAAQAKPPASEAPATTKKEQPAQPAPNKSPTTVEKGSVKVPSAAGQPANASGHASTAPAAPAASSAVAPSAKAPAVASSVSQEESEVQEEETSAPRSLGHIPAGPAIRRFAREVGVDLRQVTGSGPSGRITREDVLRVVRSGTAQRQPTAPTNGWPPAGTRDDYGPVRLEKLSRIRRTIAERMHLSWTTVPRVTNFDDADVTDLEEFRGQSKADYAKQGIKLTSLPFVVKAVAVALKAHPLLNASIDLTAGQIIYKDYVHIGIAVDTERGLVVPVLRDADKLSIPQIARQLQAIAENARAGDFSMEDLRGGTFTVSNLGAIGGTYSTPIVNVPETAILLVGRSRKMPVVVEDAIAVRLMMPLSISYDHRLIDGSAAARFLNDVIGYLQAPSRLLLSL